MLKKMPSPIYVTRSMSPDADMYTAGLTEILASHRFTNNGPNLQKLEAALNARLELPHLALTSSGTMALLLALRAAGLTGKKVITTPFTYVGTLSSLLWEGCTPIFCDIDEETLCLDPAKLANLPQAELAESAGIMPVHIYGNACEIEQIDSFASSHQMQVIYDAAQAFGTNYKGKSILGHGDFSICSFHSTKVFHTVEGGCIYSRTAEADHKVRLMGSFGHVGDEHFTVGINSKMTEPHALMGLCLLDKVNENIAERAKVAAKYDALLPQSGVRKISLHPDISFNHSYYPLIFNDEKTVLKALEQLAELNIFPRRYFYPSLTQIPYVENALPCPVAEQIARCVLALPLYAGLPDEAIETTMTVLRGVC